MSTSNTDDKDSGKIVGQGTYGCVIRPTLKCKDEVGDNKKQYDYDNKVSKIIINKEAENEISEYSNLKKYEGIDKYIVSLSDSCKPKIDKNLDNHVANCNALKIQEKYKKNKDSISMLIFEDGGVSLQEFIYMFLREEEAKDGDDVFNLTYLINFFDSIINLIEGLQFFRDNGIIHHDIKLPNLVYNNNTNVSRFIDFGLSTTVNDFVSLSKDNKNTLSRSWSYFPPENSCANHNNYFDSKCLLKFNKLYKYNEKKDDEKYAKKSEKMLKNMANIASNSVTKKKMEKDYIVFLKSTAEIFDIYSFSLAINKLFRLMYQHKWKHLNDKENNDTKGFLLSLFILSDEYQEKRLLLRKTNIKTLLKEYTSILNKYKKKVLTKPKTLKEPKAPKTLKAPKPKAPRAIKAPKSKTVKSKVKDSNKRATKSIKRNVGNSRSPIIIDSK